MLRNLELIYPKTRSQDNRSIIHMEEQTNMFIVSTVQQLHTSNQNTKCPTSIKVQEAAKSTQMK